MIYFKWCSLQILLYLSIDACGGEFSEESLLVLRIENRSRQLAARSRIDHRLTCTRLENSTSSKIVAEGCEPHDKLHTLGFLVSYEEGVMCSLKINLYCLRGQKRVKPSGVSENLKSSKWFFFVCVVLFETLTCPTAIALLGVLPPAAPPPGEEPPKAPVRRESTRVSLRISLLLISKIWK